MARSSARTRSSSELAAVTSGPLYREPLSHDCSTRVAQEEFVKWRDLADKLVTDYQDGGFARTTPDKKTIPADWMQQQGPVGTKMPAAPAAPGREVSQTANARAGCRFLRN